MVVHAFNPSTGKAEAGRSLWVQSMPVLQSEFQDRLQSYTEKSILKKKEKEKERKEGRKKEIVKYLPNGVLPSGKNNDIFKFSEKWVDLEKIILSEVTQTQKDKYNIYPLISDF